MWFNYLVIGPAKDFVVNKKKEASYKSRNKFDQKQRFFESNITSYKYTYTCGVKCK